MTESPSQIPRDEIASRVRAVLRGQFGPVADDLADDAELVNAIPGFDSLAALETISRVEAEFGIEVDFVGHDVRYWFATPGRITRFVLDRLEDRAVLGGTP